MMMLILISCWACVFLSILPIQANSKFCNHRNLTYEDIEHLSENCTTNSCGRPSHKGYTYLFPQLTINCNGSLVTWTAAGNLSHGDLESNPTLIVWRSSSENPQKYTVHQRTSLLSCNGSMIPQNSEGVYTCKLQRELPVQEGDVMGMEIPNYFGSDRSQFNPYFEMHLDKEQKIFIHKGTNLLNFIRSDSYMENSQPLLAVDVEPDDPDFTEHVLTPRTTDKTREAKKIVIELWKMISISAGVFAVLLVMTILLAMQCCMIVRNKSKREQPGESEEGELSTEPYAVIDVQSLKGSSKAALRNAQRPVCPIPLHKNPSYAMNLTASASKIVSGGSSMHANSEEMLLRDRSMSPNHDNGHATDPSGIDSNDAETLPDRIGRYYQNTPDDQSSENIEGSYAYIGTTRRPDEVDSGINLQQFNSNTEWTRELSEVSSEHIYY